LIALCVVVFLPVFLTVTKASANGRFPAANRIVLSPSDPNLVIVRATYGILPSPDHGTTWRFLCEDALGLPQSSSSDPALALTQNNALVAGLSIPGGLEVSADLGCNWSCAGGALANETIADIAVRPDGHGLVALTSTLLDDAGSGRHSQVLQSSDDGAHWTPLGVALDPSLLVTTIDVAPSNSHRLYVSATRGAGPTRTAALDVSDDDGATWIERPIPVEPGYESSAYIGGVDPVDADRVYVRSVRSLPGPQPSHLLVTADAGRSFRSALDLPDPMLGFALSPDGSKVYAGSVAAGLFVGDRATTTFVSRSPIHVQCLATRGAELWACSDRPSGFLAGISTDDGATFTPRLHIDSVQAPVPCGVTGQTSFACGADANAAQCSGETFRLFCANFGCQLDSGLTDGGFAPAGASPSPSCRCTFARNRGALALELGALGALVAVGQRRRSRR
jgi:hypothetical protein